VEFVDRLIEGRSTLSIACYGKIYFLLKFCHQNAGPVDSVGVVESIINKNLPMDIMIFSNLVAFFILERLYGAFSNLRDMNNAVPLGRNRARLEERLRAMGRIG
jgi:hypothetical protein